MILYKYTTASDYVFDSIKNKQLYFRRMPLLNDPHEGSFKFNENNLREIIEANPGHLERINFLFNHFINGFRDNVFILSLSEKENNQAMWAYYANNHRGIVIEYEITNHIDSLNDTDKNQNEVILGKDSNIFHKVAYQDNFMIFDIPNNITDDKAVKEQLFPCLITKSADWSGEAEFRAIIRDESAYSQGLFLQLGNNSIKSIIFGHGYSRSEVFEFINKQNFSIPVKHAQQLPGEKTMYYLDV